MLVINIGGKAVKLFTFCMIAISLVVIGGGGQADDERALEAPVRLVVKAIPIGKIASDIFDERRSGCTVFVRPGMVSPDLTHVVQLVKRGKRAAVLFDGIASPKYDTPYREPFCYQPVFSDDGRHYAFTAWRGKRMVIVRDGVEDPRDTGGEVSGLIFSPQNDRFAYVVSRKFRQGYKCNLVVDGVPLDTYDSVGQLNFSRDGMHTCYIAHQGEAEFLIKDGVSGKHYDGSTWLIDLSPDGRRVTYRVDRNDKKMIVVDATEGQEYDDTSAPKFSPDGLHVAYLARRESKVFLVVDGSESTPYPERAGPLLNHRVYFSPDSKHTAYLSETASSERLIVDGVMQKEYLSPFGGGMWFSPDGKRLAFYDSKRLHIVDLDFDRAVASRIVVDDIVDTRAAEPVCDYLPTMFLPNSRRAGYSLLEERAIVVEGDGKSWLHRHKIGDSEWQMLDKFEPRWNNGDTSNRISFLAAKKNELFRVEVEIISQGGTKTKLGIRHL